MDLHDFDNLDSGSLFNNFNSPYGDFDLTDIERRVLQFDNDANTLYGGFAGEKSTGPNLTNELDENQRQLSADDEEYKTNNFVNDARNLPLFGNEEQATSPTSTNQSRQISGRRQSTPYTYDRVGRLEGNEGYEKEVIEHYLCNHHFYGERRNYKDCGLTLWIQRAPQNTDYYHGTAPALCLYRHCCVNHNRHILPGSMRIAFDEKTAPGRDPQINAGYVHLRCLEAYVPYLRQMFGKLNFKVEGRGPQKNYSWLRNPTIFTNMNAIAYAEEYLEDCRKEDRVGGKRSDQILLSAGIEKQLRSQYSAVREVERKILEMEGWDDMKALIDLKYPQACGTAPMANSIESPQQPKVSSPISEATNRPDSEPYGKENNHTSEGNLSLVKQGKQRAEEQNEYKWPIVKQIKPKTSKKRPKKRDAPPKKKEPEAVTEPKPLKKGEGKIKWRMSLSNGEEVWEQYEDLWSPLVSDLEENTEDENPKPKRKYRPRSDKPKEKKRSRTAPDEDSGGDETRAKRKRLEGDNENWGDDEPWGRKRRREGDNDDLGDDEPRKRRRRQSEDDGWNRERTSPGIMTAGEYMKGLREQEERFQLDLDIYSRLNVG